jgi:hypothetical protein
MNTVLTEPGHTVYMIKNVEPLGDISENLRFAPIVNERSYRRYRLYGLTTTTA